MWPLSAVGLQLFLLDVLDRTLSRLQMAYRASPGRRTRPRGHRMGGEARMHLLPLEQVPLAPVSQWRLTAKPGGGATA